MVLTFKREAWKGFLFLFLGLAGCASIDFTDYKQTVKVVSEPPGAVIYDGEDQVGVTPAFVRVRRRLNPEISLKFPGEPERKIPLERHYRWGDSFAMNIVFWALAPVGWGVDLLTGTAWKMSDPPVQKFSGPAPPGLFTKDVIAIAPPETVDAETSDTVGSLIEKKAAATENTTILSYEDTAPAFEFYSSDQGLTWNRRLRYNLYYQLKANKIFVSKVERAPEGFLVHGHYHDLFSEQDSNTRTWMLTSDDGKAKEEVSEHHAFTEYFHLLPNTLFLNLAVYQPQFRIDRQVYNASSGRDHTVLDDFLDVIGFIGLDHLARPRLNVAGQFTFMFIPSFNFSWVKLEIPDYLPLRGATFDRIYANGGYGIEVGHLSRVGLFYADLVPVLTYSRIHAQIPDEEDQRISRLSVQLMDEIGYSRFVNDHLIVRLFARGINEDSRLWQNAIRRATHQDENVDKATSIFWGIAFGYYLPSSLNRKGNWSAVEMKR